MATTPDTTRKWWVLVGASAGLFLLMLDSTVVALALPSIQRDLGASGDQLQLVVNVYLLVIAVLVITAGRFGDIFGRRRVLLGGFVVFGAGSVLCAAAWDADVVVLGRGVMAAGAAAMLPLSLALVTDVFPPDEQPRAIGIWTAISAIALGIGPLIGGALTDLDWRLIFLIGIPVIVAGVAIIRTQAPERRDESTERRVDVPGLVLLTAGLAAVVYALIQADEWGWGSARTLGLLGGGAVALVAFWVIEHRVREPIVDFSLFRNRPYLGATVAAFGIVCVYWTLMFYVPQYLQNILGYTAILAGVAVLPVTVPMIVISSSAPKLIGALGARATMTGGLALGLAGLLFLTRISVSSGYALVFPGLLLVGLSFALVYAPMSTAAMQAMPKEKAGIASGALAMNRILAGAVGLAMVGAVYQTLLADKLDSLLDAGNLPLDQAQRSQLDGLLAGSESAREAVSAQDSPQVAATIQHAAAEAFTFALSNATWVLVGIVAISTVLTAVLVEPRQPTTEVPEAARSPEHHRHHSGRFHL